ncbi:MAG: putative NiFe hydrogenase small subunit [Firmicutes bacterium]|nr:putative NiFe hydrogenase small subunit [Bacillota bacterium]
MNTTSGSCPNFSMRLETASMLFHKAVDAVQQGQIPKRNLIWLELTGCAGNIISLLNGEDPDFKGLISQMVHYLYDNSLMAAEGEFAMDQLFDALDSDYILAVEGAVSTKDEGLYTIIGRWKGRPITAYEVIQTFGERAAHVIAVGTCASDGGISAARPNPAQCVGIQNLLNRKVIKLPGCPCHPDWFMGTLAYTLLFGEPELDARQRPLMFYSTLIHDLCPRRPCFDRGVFATQLGEDTCMFKLGCRGPVTRVDCPIRKWNDRVNWPIGDDGPCIGCAMFGFPDKMEPFVRFDTT